MGNCFQFAPGHQGVRIVGIIVPELPVGLHGIALVSREFVGEAEEVEEARFHPVGFVVGGMTQFNDWPGQQIVQYPQRLGHVAGLKQCLLDPGNFLIL
jgi:hypothetical protein